jgi:hypothetical protein
MSNYPRSEQMKSAPCPIPPDPVHSELMDELDKIRDVRKARNSRDTRLPSISSGLATEKIYAVSCPTCGAQPRQKCELHSGQPRTEPHRDRCLSAEDLVV